MAVRVCGELRRDFFTGRIDPMKVFHGKQRPCGPGTCDLAITSISRRRRASGSCRRDVSGSPIASRSNSRRLSSEPVSTTPVQLGRDVGAGGRTVKSADAEHGAHIRDNACNGTFAVCDSHRAITALGSVILAPAANSRMSLLFPRPGSPTTLTTDLPPLKASSKQPGQRPAYQRALVAAHHCAIGLDPLSRRAANGPRTPLTVTHSVGPSTAECSTKRAVDAVHMTPPGSAAASIRWAIPTDARRRYSCRGRRRPRRRHVTRVQADPNLQRHAVSGKHFSGQASRLRLDLQCGDACPQRVVFQANGAPNTAINPSPVNLLTVPWYR